MSGYENTSAPPLAARSATTDHDHAIDKDAVRIEQIRLVYRQLPQALFTTVLALVALVAVLWDVAPPTRLLIWTGVLLAITGVRYGLCRVFPDTALTPEGATKWSQLFLMGTVASGLCWGLGSVALLAVPDTVYQLFLGFILAGLGAGAVSSLSAHPRAYPSFLLPAVVPFVIVMLAVGERMHFALGAMALCYVAMMLILSSRLTATIEQSLRLRFENVSLIEEISSSNKQLEMANGALRAEITERRAAQDVLRKSEQKLRLHAQQTPLAFIEWDLGFRAAEWYPAAERMFGYTRDEAIGKRAHQLFGDRKTCEPIATIWQNVVRDKQSASVTITHRVKSGQTITCDWYYTPVVDETGRVLSVITLAQDVTANRAAEERLNFLAYFDGLTGLPNRTLFSDRLAQSLAEAKRQTRFAGVMLLDIDHFKVVNDTLGHEAGDQLLKEIAKRLQVCVRESDTIARLGGDEFGIVLGDLLDPSNVFTVAQKILDAFLPPFTVFGQEVYLAASIGITFYPTDGDTLEGLVKNADSAMYHAKSLGRNNYQFYSSKLTERAHARLALETSLRRATEREDFLLHYQPKVDLASGQVTGVEALLRWRDNGHGDIPPNTFVPIAEESGLILPIGEWALRTACKEVRAWQQAGLPNLKLAVNLSSRQFRHNRLVTNTARILDETGFDPELLEFEITESILMDHDPTVSAVLTQLRNLGISISIDDFGTGYSSLSYLKRFPIDTLKIDRSFVRDVPTDLDDVAIVRAIIGMARSLRMRTVAEGVELDEQRRFLREQGCDEMQGFLYGQPLPGREMRHLLSLRAGISRLN